MNLMWFIYAASVVPSIGSWATGFGVVALLACFAAFIGWRMGVDSRDGSDDQKELFSFAKGVAKISIPVMLISIILSVACPDKKTIYLMGAARGVEMVAENPQVQSIASSSLQLLEQQIKGMLIEEEKADDASKKSQNRGGQNNDEDTENN